MSVEHVEHMWYGYISWYTRQGFTYISDRLPALSVLAARAQERINQAYLVGIWESTLVEGLGWATVERFDYDHPSFLTPSWSWASSRGAVSFLYQQGDHLPMLQVRHNRVNTRVNDVSGQVAQGRLTLRGKWLSTNLEAARITPSESYGKLNVFEYLPYSDKNSFQFLHVLYLDSQYNLNCTSASFSCLLLQVVNTDSMLSFVPRPRPQSVGVALVLEPTGNLRNGVKEYSRVGLLILPFEYY